MRSYALTALFAPLLVSACGWHEIGQSSSVDTSNSPDHEVRANQEDQMKQDALAQLAAAVASRKQDWCETIYRTPERQYLEEAANGDAVSQYRLAGLYNMEDICVTDARRSAYWMERAAANGIVDAIRETGLNYLRGRGFLEDDKKAYAYLSIYVAVSNLNPFVPAVTEYPLREVKDLLSQNDLDEAKRMADGIYSALPDELIQSDELSQIIKRRTSQELNIELP
jgi:hypothetical protein